MDSGNFGGRSYRMPNTVMQKVPEGVVTAGDSVMVEDRLVELEQLEHFKLG